MSGGLVRAGWGGVLLLALLWPGRQPGWLDGAPLDGRAEAVLIGGLFPLLWWWQPAFLRGRWARMAVLGLLVWKLAGWWGLAQGGWCGQFWSERRIVTGEPRVQRSWDVRTSRWGWGTDGTCSAIVARPYAELADFPMWFINLLDERNIRFIPRFSTPQRPPNGRFGMRVRGYLTVEEPGVFTLAIGRGMAVRGEVGGQPVGGGQGEDVAIALPPGVHAVALEGTLTGTHWRFEPRWNGRSVWGTTLTTVRPPSPRDRVAWRLSRVVTPLGVIFLLGSWVIAGIRRVGFTKAMAGWVAAASLVLAVLGWAQHGSPIPFARGAVLLLFGCFLVPVPQRLRHLRGAFLLFGVPWLSLFVADGLDQVGRFTLYTLGDDWLTFQIYAHRIFMQGYWLEGGQPTFYYQPLYRWILGVLHLIFGDSSVGELYADALGMLLGALFAFWVVRAFGGFWWGVGAGVTTLATFSLGPPSHLIGRGLSEIVAGGWAVLAAFALLRARLGRWLWAVGAGIFAILMFYTRLNHLPFAVALSAFALPRGASWRRSRGRSLVRRAAPVVGTYLMCVVLGVALFALRTWYYTGVFSVFHGTQRQLVSTGLGWSTVASPAVWARVWESVLMVVTVQDPPRFDPRAVLVVAGVVCACLTLLRAPGCGRLPVGLATVCLGAVAGAIFARGAGYPGRFSVHLVPVATAMSFCTAALVSRRLRQVTR